MYRDELDALNALVEAQRQTNELLADLLRHIGEKEGEPSAAQRRGRRNNGKAAE